MVGLNYTPARSGGAEHARDTLEVERFTNAVRNVPYLEGRLLADETVTTGNNTLRHNLGRVPRGYWLTKVSGQTTTVEVETPDVVASEGFVQQSAPGATEDYVLSTAPTAGNALVLAIFRDGETDTLAGITDDGGNSWALVDQVPYDAAKWTQHMELWACYDIAAGTTTITVDYDSAWGGETLLQVFELSGVQSSGLLTDDYEETDNDDPVTVNTGWKSAGSKSISLCFVASGTLGGVYPQFSASGWTAERRVGGTALVNDAMESFSRTYTAVPSTNESITINKDHTPTAGLCTIITSWVGTTTSTTTTGEPIKVPALVSSDRFDMVLNFDQDAVVSLWVF